jgi:hypothetical protein
MEADRKSEPEKRILRQCLRETDTTVMEGIMREAFRPRAKLVCHMSSHAKHNINDDISYITNVAMLTVS